MPDVITDNLDLWSSALLTKSTAGRGSNGKLEAYGIKKLRELILELAVRGKLVPQDTNDEPASELFKRIQTEKMKLIAEGKIKKDKPLSPIADEDKPFTQPPGWVWVRLGEIAETIRGVTYGKSDASDIPRTDYVPLLRGNNINRTLNFDNPVFVPKQLLNDAQYVKAGDIVIAMSSGSADLVGKAAQAIEDFEGGFGAFCGVIRPASAETHSFFGFFFQTPLYRNRAAGHGKGIGINNLQKTALQTLEIPLPPLAEQHRIVAKVNELMALCDQLEQQQTHSIEAHQTLVASLLGTLTRVESQQEFSEAWARIASYFDTLFTTEASIDQLKQTILQLAVMGKLVPQAQNDEPASSLFKRIQAEKAKLIEEGKIKKDKPLAAITDEEKPFVLPKNWEWVRLGDISSAVQYGYTDSANHGSKEVLFLRITDIQDDAVDWATVPGCDISPSDFDSYALENCDIVIARTGGTIGKSYLVAGLSQKAVFASYLIRIGNLSATSEQYKKVFLGSQLYWAQLIASSMGTGQPNVNGTALKHLIFSLPPLAEQHRIVAKVDELMALCETLKARLADAQTTQLHLADAIVEQAVC